MLMKTSASPFIIALILLLSACDEPTEAPRVEIPVVVSGAGLTPVTTDLGYAIEVTEARMAFNNLAFTIAGEAHANFFWQNLSQAIIPSAHAHPGHFAGGEVTGELPGEFLVDWLANNEQQLGVATLLAGTYMGVNFTFARASEDWLEAGDPLIGHTAIFAGLASRQGTAIPFTITIDSPKDRELIGAPLTRADDASNSFQARIDASSSSGTLLLQLVTEDPVKHNTLFDGIDFAALHTDSEGTVHIGPTSQGASEDAYNLFRRTFQITDHYMVYYQD